MSERLEHITLGRLQAMIKGRLDEAFPLSQWVSAEISELKVNYSGHCYMELVEKGGDNQVPRARAAAVVWRATFGAISSYFAAATGAELAAGMNVLLKVAVSYHELYGLSLVVSDIDPAYTIGEQERLRRETVARLQDEGVFDMNRELTMPVPVQRVAVVSSKNAAGYQDFMNELTAGGFRFEVTLFDAFMQGHGAEDSIIAALDAIAAGVDAFDAVVLIRGGGAQSDLGTFDSYRLCSHLAQFPLPVVTGIGHDKDRSVADMVASVALKTPTAVAVWLTGAMRELDDRLATAAERVRNIAARRLADRRAELRLLTLSLSGTSVRLARGAELQLEKLSFALAGSARETLAAENARVTRAALLAGALRPERILAMGFSIVRKAGVAVKDSSILRNNDMLDITFAKGKAAAEVKISGK